MAGRIEELTPAGEEIWAVQTQVGAGFGYSSSHDSLYPETE